MAINLPGPYEVEIPYTIDGLTHVMRFNCIAIGSPVAGTDAADIDLATKGAGSEVLDVAVNQAWNIIRGGFANDCTAGNPTLWRYVTGTYEKDFITSFALDNPVGSHAGSHVAAQQSIASLRSGAGGYLKFTFLETTVSANVVIPLVPLSGGDWFEQLAFYALSADGWFIARDDSFPIAGLSFSTGQNEKTFRSRFR